MERNKYIRYIYDNIDKLSNHQNYIKLLTFHGCPYTTNSNGIFVNLNKLNDKVISDFYIRIMNELTNEDNIEDKYEKEILNIKDNKPKTRAIIKKTLVENMITIDLFSKEDKDIIEYSKKYNL